MNFHEFMWKLAHEPLKKSSNQKNDISKLLHAFGEVLEDTKDNIFLIRRQGLLMTATGKALDAHGGERFPRYNGESDEQYRNRLLARKELARKAGTVEGMLLTLQSLGYSDAEIHPFYVFDPERWAEFYILLNKDTLNKLNNLDIVMSEIMRVKTASSYPIYAFAYYKNIEIITRSMIGNSYLNMLICGVNKCGQVYKEAEGLVTKGTIQFNTSSLFANNEIAGCGTMISGSKEKVHYLGIVFSSNSLINSIFIKALTDIEICGNNKCGEVYKKADSSEMASIIQFKSSNLLANSDIGSCGTIVSGSKEKIHYQGIILQDGYSVQSIFTQVSSDIEICGTVISGSKDKNQFLGNVYNTNFSIKPIFDKVLTDIEKCKTIIVGRSESTEDSASTNIISQFEAADKYTLKASKTLICGRYKI